MARTATGESVLSRAVRIFEAFTPDERVLSVSQIARRAGRHLAGGRTGRCPPGRGGRLAAIVPVGTEARTVVGVLATAARGITRTLGDSLAGS
jgi:hypothetical protein